MADLPWCRLLVGSVKLYTLPGVGPYRVQPDRTVLQRKLFLPEMQIQTDFNLHLHAQHDGAVRCSTVQPLGFAFTFCPTQIQQIVQFALL